MYLIYLHVVTTYLAHALEELSPRTWLWAGRGDMYITDNKTKTIRGNIFPSVSAIWSAPPMSPAFTSQHKNTCLVAISKSSSNPKFLQAGKKSLLLFCSDIFPTFSSHCVFVFVLLNFCFHSNYLTSSLKKLSAAADFKSLCRVFTTLVLAGPTTAGPETL